MLLNRQGAGKVLCINDHVSALFCRKFPLFSGAQKDISCKMHSQFLVANRHVLMVEEEGGGEVESASTFSK